MNRSNIWIIGGRGLDVGQRRVQNPSGKYERVIDVTGYGLFNIALLLAATPIAWTIAFDITSAAFILEAIECTFELNYLRKGIMLATPYIGMVAASPIWRFLCEDSLIWSLGKRNLIIVGFIADALCNIGLVYNQNYWYFLALKFLSGVLISGPLSLIHPFLSEFHHSKYQKNFNLWSGLLFALPYIFAPALAAIYVPRYHGTFVEVFGLKHRTWQIYLLICAIPSVFFGLLTIWFLPKSPKYLMSRGRPDETMAILTKIYRFNIGYSKFEYPFSELKQNEQILKTRHSFHKDLGNFKVLISKSFVPTFSNILVLHFIAMMGANTMRLWVPNVFTALNNFETLIGSLFDQSRLITLCQMLFPGIPLHNHTCHCIDFTDPGLECDIYVNSTIIGSSAVGFGFLFSCLTTSNRRQKAALIFSFSMSAIGSFFANWAVEIPYMLTFCSLIIVSARISSGTIITYVSEIIPQDLRSTASFCVSLIGNLGAAFGVVLFSILIQIDCLSAFLSIGVLASTSTILSMFLRKSSFERFKAPAAMLTGIKYY